MQKILKIAAWKIRVLEQYGFPLALLWARLHVGLVFWRSGMTKYANLDSAVDLFKSEYLPEWEKHRVKELFGFIQITFPVPPAEFGAYAACFTELTCAALLIIGLAGRAAAFGIFMLTLSIEMFVYPGTSDHWNWMVLMAIIITAGCGKISLDWLIRRKLMNPSSSGKTVDIH